MLIFHSIFQFILKLWLIDSIVHKGVIMFFCFVLLSNNNFVWDVTLLHTFTWLFLWEPDFLGFPAPVLLPHTCLDFLFLWLCVSVLLNFDSSSTQDYEQSCWFSLGHSRGGPASESSGLLILGPGVHLALQPAEPLSVLVAVLSLTGQRFQWKSTSHFGVLLHTRSKLPPPTCTVMELHPTALCLPAFTKGNHYLQAIFGMVLLYRRVVPEQ